MSDNNAILRSILSLMTKFLFNPPKRKRKKKDEEEEEELGHVDSFCRDILPLSRAPSVSSKLSYLPLPS